MHDGYRLFPQFFTPAETARCLERVESRRDLFHAVAVKARMNLKYHVIDGNKIRQHFPDFFDLAENRLREHAQEVVGRPLELMRDAKRTMRIQSYRAKDEGFLWHFDGGLYGAIVTLVNTNLGATEIISPRLSRILKPVPFLLFPFPRILTLARPKKIVADPGDLLVLHGGALIHRGITQLDEGERVIFAVSYDPVGRKPNPIREFIARRLNF